MQTDSIAENLFFTTVRIDTISLDGSSGSGTGFLYAHKIGNDEIAVFIVTNKHVVEGVRTGSITFHKRVGAKPDIGQAFRLDILDWSADWFGHPSPDVDIAIAPYFPMAALIKEKSNVDLFIRSLDSSMLVTTEQAEHLDAIETVTFIGYPNGIWDSRNFMPVARRGTTASPLSIDFEGTPRFLIDASVFGGSSGSPVFILNQGIISDKYGNSTVGSRLLFIGVVAAVFFRTSLNQVISVPIPTQTRPMAEQREMIDLGIVFKARTVVETIEALLIARPQQPLPN
jgi:Trypsin-like peptidase domain